jgi:hypothetical protein
MFEMFHVGGDVAFSPDGGHIVLPGERRRQQGSRVTNQLT